MKQTDQFTEHAHHVELANQDEAEALDNFGPIWPFVLAGAAPIAAAAVLALCMGWV